MIDFEVTEEQLLLALDAVQKAKKQGFTDTTALLNISSIEENGSGAIASFSDSVILKAHPKKSKFNWGRKKSDMINWYLFKDGKFDTF